MKAVRQGNERASQKLEFRAMLRETAKAVKQENEEANYLCHVCEVPIGGLL